MPKLTIQFEGPEDLILAAMSQFGSVYAELDTTEIEPAKFVENPNCSSNICLESAQLEPARLRDVLGDLIGGARQAADLWKSLQSLDVEELKLAARDVQLAIQHARSAAERIKVAIGPLLGGDVFSVSEIDQAILHCNSLDIRINEAVEASSAAALVPIIIEALPVILDLLQRFHNRR